MALCQRLFGTDNIIIFVWKISCTHKCPSLFCGHGKIWSLIFGKLPSLWVAQFQANKTQMHICKPYQHWALNKQIHSGEFKSTLVTETALRGSVWTNSTVEARAMYTSNLDVAKSSSRTQGGKGCKKPVRILAVFCCYLLMEKMKPLFISFWRAPVHFWSSIY